MWIGTNRSPRTAPACCCPVTEKASSRWRPALRPTRSAPSTSRCITSWRRHHGMRPSYFLPCARSCCRRSRKTHQSAPGLSTTPAFPRRASIRSAWRAEYCGELGEQDNYQIAVTLSVASDLASLPVALRLYLPEPWADDQARRAKAGIPDGIEFQTKPRIALDQIRQAIADGVPKAVALADAGYGNDTAFRSGLTELGLEYVVGVQGSMTVWAPRTQPLPARAWSGRGRRTKLLRVTATSNQSRYPNLPRAWPGGRGRRCAGVRAPRATWSRASLTFAFARLIETIGVPNRGPRNGC